ncbi:MAG: D-aminoacyl-tRNA deacylase [Opitutaceae bacterium]
MRAVIQRVAKARVEIGGECCGEIGLGLVVFLGVARDDAECDCEWLGEKIAALRIFPDEGGRMNRSICESGGGALVVSQFTLLASLAKGTRPSFNAAAKAETAAPLYEAFLARLAAALGRPVAAGRFGADMKIALVNDGPVTILLDSKRRD